ncbi:hypothetical protein [Cupriavidus consociatus]|uniref:hypothetical protein n=1 Tax=Cupriavidus consociatus TaxID=2821357 RepID=UPI001AE4E210|nr:MULTISPECIES: hypothetical protein [unclassified Cupriavidus]MBP0625442.1 hypothetical protein [Cupriavidus sp. LEh25]MDK2662186.1 hypothetical protein [Cupriavidus sp. LEh21]
MLKLTGIPPKPSDHITTKDIVAMANAGAEAGYTNTELHLIAIPTRLEVDTVIMMTPATT